MAFTDEQRQALKAKLSYRHVKTRAGNGTPIPYVEGWHVIAEANRIFGYDSWDRTTLSPRCLWAELQRGQTACFYTAKVRVTVRAGGATIVREGIGTGIGRSESADLAHEIALKAAETDATKRALATFGNPFGLALYDKEKLQVTKSRPKAVSRAKPKAIAAPATPAKLAAAPEFVLVSSDGSQQCLVGAAAFVDAVLKLVPSLPTIDSLYAFWAANLESLAQLRARADGPDHDPIAGIITALKARARALGRLDDTPGIDGSVPPRHGEPALALPKEKRIRSKEHLEFVARQPCLVCGRRPAQAHHLRFAQPRALALKVSDEFTVPLCTVHHDALHRTGDERAWWARHGIIDPLKIAGRLWAASRLSPPGDDSEPEVLQPPATEPANGQPAGD